MILCSPMSFVVLSCIMWLAAPALLCTGLCYMCADLDVCAKMNSSEFNNCKDHLSVLQSPVKKSRLTVLYTSPLNVALLLNNSEVLDLSLVQCRPTADQPALFEYFTVQRLEKLTVRYPFLKPGLHYEVIIGKDRDAPYHEEARIAVIHTSVLTGTTKVKSYTVQTQVDRNGMMSFPEIFMSRSGLSEMDRLFVTFLY